MNYVYDQKFCAMEMEGIIQRIQDPEDIFVRSFPNLDARRLQ